MTAVLHLLDPPATPAWAPFAGVRPVSELRAGALLVRERWELVTTLPTASILSDAVPGFADTGPIPVVPSATPISGPALVVRSDFAPDLDARPGPDRVGTFVDRAGAPVGWWVPRGSVWSGADHVSDPASPLSGMHLTGTASLLDVLEHRLGPDCLQLLDPSPVPAGTIVLGDPSLLAAGDAVIEPGVVLDLRGGPIVLEEGVVVRSGTRLEGPLHVHVDTLLLGGSIRHSVIGPSCRVHGEVASSVFTGFANKAHDGFLGHSVLGHWVNLGAGTITSNLKNTYGEVSLALPEGPVPTGRMFLGSLLGDHAKTAIGTLLATGTIVGAGASVHGPPPVPRHVPAFSWGTAGTERVTLEGFLRVASRVMPRRGVEMTSDREESLRRLHLRLTR